jgi:hypothetical protein
MIDLFNKLPLWCWMSLKNITVLAWSRNHLHLWNLKVHHFPESCYCMLCWAISIQSTFVSPMCVYTCACVWIKTLILCFCGDHLKWHKIQEHCSYGHLAGAIKMRKMEVFLYILILLCNCSLNVLAVITESAILSVSTRILLVNIYGKSAKKMSQVITQLTFYSS